MTGIPRASHVVPAAMHASRRCALVLATAACATTAPTAPAVRVTPLVRAEPAPSPLLPAAPAPPPPRCETRPSPYLLAPQGFLSRWRTSLAVASRAQVRALLLGDSHVEDGSLARRLRVRLRGDAPDGGPGLLQPARVRHYGPRSDVIADGWTIRLGLRDDRVGATGLLLESGASASSLVLPRPAGALWLSALVADEGGALALGDRRVSTEGVPIPDDGPIALRHVGPGPIALAALALDAGFGVTLDAAGVVGARVSHLARWGPRALDELLRWRAPALVVLAYGTNDAADPAFDRDRFTRDLTTVVAAVRASGAAGLVIGAPDFALRRRGGSREAPGALAAVIAAQREVSAAQGVAFFDARAWMGGPGSIARFVAERRAWPDHVHLTPRGYEALADAIADAIAAVACEAP